MPRLPESLNAWGTPEFEAVLKREIEQLAASAPGAYGSIHRTLGHIIWAEADYVGRLTGVRPQARVRPEDGPSVAEISVFAEQVAAALLDAVQRTPPTSIVHEEEEGLFMDYQARALFIQVINHGIEHRTNITTTLSGLGLAAPEVDGWAYLFAHGDPFRAERNYCGRAGC